MPGLAATILALVVVGAAVGIATVAGGALWALPIVFIVAVIWVAALTVRRGRQGRPLRGEPEGPIEFTERDRETLTPKQDE